MAQAITSQQTTLGVSTSGSSPITYTDIKEITSFSGLDGSASEIDVTHLQSTAKEFILGLQDFGNFTIEISYDNDDAGQLILRAAKESGNLHYFKLTFSDSTYITFSAYVMSMSVGGGVDGKVESSVTLRITGSVTYSS